MVNEELYDLFNSDDVDKQLIINIEGSTDVIKNEDIYSGSFGYSESICSLDNLRFGSCESASIKFTMSNVLSKLKGKTLIPTIQVGSNAENIIQLGKFIVETDSPSEDKKSRTINAYDALYKARNMNVTAWYNRLIFPLNLKTVRDSFFALVGVEQEEIILPNDGAYIYEMPVDVSKSNIYGSYILSDILQLNGCFGRIGRNGLFEYVFLEKDQTKAIRVDTSIRKDIVYEDYVTHDINQIKLTQSGNNIDFYYGEGDNSYPISLQILQVGQSKNLLDSICANIYEKIQHIRFSPVNLTKRGNPCLQAGDFIVTKGFNDEDIYSYILEKDFTIDCLQGTTDVIISQGKEVYTRDISDNSDIIFDNQRTINEINKNSFYAYTFTNEEIITTATTEKIIIKFNISATAEADAIFICTIPVNLTLDGYVKIKYFIDGAEVKDDEIKGYYEKGYNIITISDFFKLDENGRLTLTLSISTEYVESETRQQNAKIISLENYVKNGTYTDPVVSTTPPTLTIARHGVKASLFAQGLASGTKWDGTLNFAEEVGDITINRSVVLINPQDTAIVGVQVPVGYTLSENVTSITLNRSVLFTDPEENIIISKIVMFYMVDTSKAGKYTYDSRYVTVNDAYKLKTEYNYYGIEETIDSGRMESIQLDFTQYTVEGVDITNVRN